MGKKNKNKANKQQQQQQQQPSPSPAASDSNSNDALLKQQKSYIASLSDNDRDNFFSNDLVTPERRAEIWMEQADLGSDLVDKYSWATPDERALKILKKFSPIVEVGCGANAYWCRVMKSAGIDVVGYDIDSQEGGKIDRKKQQQHGFPVKTGGPEVLKKQSKRTLFLCYPDEDVLDTVEQDDVEEPQSLGSACLEYFTGTYVIHVGELYGATLSVEQAPWGRSSGPQFQQRLAAEYHCLLKAKLTNWLHVRDTISVWKRSETCEMVFAADSEDEEEDEEVEYRHIPKDECLPTDIAAPCLAYLLAGGDPNDAAMTPKPKAPPVAEVPWDDDDENNKGTVLETPKPPVEVTNEPTTGSGKKKKKKKKRQRADSATSEKSDSSKIAKQDYSCPW